MASRSTRRSRRGTSATPRTFPVTLRTSTRRNIFWPARRELDPKKREQTYQETQRKIMSDLPIIPLIMQPERMVHTAKLKGMPTLEPLWGLDLARHRFE